MGGIIFVAKDGGDPLAREALGLLAKIGFKTKILSEGETAPAGSIAVTTPGGLNGKIWSLRMYDPSLAASLVWGEVPPWADGALASLVVRWSPDGFSQTLPKVVTLCQSW